MIVLNINPSDDIQSILNLYALDQTIELRLSPGLYHQKLMLYHPHLSIVGESLESTIISFDDYSYKMHEDGLLYNTFRTSTVTVIGDNITFKNMTIKNSAGHGLTIGQAVALSVYGTNFKAINCHIIGHQDTLFIGPLPKDLTERYHHFLPKVFLHNQLVNAHFDHCQIEGDVDFIFGSGTALFNHCKVISVGKGYIFAPSTYQEFEYGMIAINTHFEIIDLSYIARPWREYGQVHLIDSTFNGPIEVARYNDWQKRHFTFKEIPYIRSPLSEPLNPEAMNQIKAYMLKTFGIN